MFRLLQVIAFLLALVATSSFSPIAASSSSRVSGVWGTTRQQSPVILNAVIEKEAPLKTPGPAVLEPETDSDGSRTGASRTEKREKKGNEAWEVRIYNDGLNTREHVARSLVQITGMSENGAYSTMMQAHQNGIAVVGRWVYEIAEMYHEALRKQGIVCDLVPVEEKS
jgi:ATP-dependent Clp protease adaptor protein ClpS